MFKRFCLVASGLMLSACVQYSEIQTPTQNLSFSSEAVKSAVQGFVVAEIRAVQSTAKGVNDDSEMLGVNCLIRGNGFRGEVTTPANVNLPWFSGSADPIQVTCNDGTTQKTKDVSAVNITLRNIQSTQSSGGIAGVIITAAVKGVAKAARDPLKDRYEYPRRIVTLFGIDN